VLVFGKKLLLQVWSLPRMVASRSERNDQPSSVKDTIFFIHKLMFNVVALML
jgi:hypothetical protein